MSEIRKHESDKEFYNKCIKQALKNPYITDSYKQKLKKKLNE